MNVLLFVRYFSAQSVVPCLSALFCPGRLFVVLRSFHALRFLVTCSWFFSFFRIGYVYLSSLRPPELDTLFRHLRLWVLIKSILRACAMSSEHREEYRLPQLKEEEHEAIRNRVQYTLAVNEAIHLMPASPNAMPTLVLGTVK